MLNYDPPAAEGGGRASVGEDAGKADGSDSAETLEAVTRERERDRKREKKPKTTKESLINSTAVALFTPLKLFTSLSLLPL